MFIAGRIDKNNYRPATMEKLFIETDEMDIVPLDNYPGRKGADGTWQKILAEIPQCDLFIDAMCGSGFIGSLVKGCRVYMNDIDRLTIDGIRKQAGRNVELGNQSYLEVIKRFNNASPRRVFYFDPPYDMETRSNQVRLYRYDWNREDHLIFLKAVQAIKCPTIISHYPCELYDKALKKWRKITYKTVFHGRVRDESIYMNFPQPVLLQFPALTGADFTDRQRIKRKVESMINKLKKAPANERAAILSSVIAHFNYITQK